MTALEFKQWQAFARVEPIGQRRLDYLAAWQAFKLSQAHGVQCQFDDFVVNFWDEGEDIEQSPEEIAEITMMGMRAGKK